MATYGRNFDFRVPPRAEARAGRFSAPTTLLSGSGAGGGTAAGSASGAGLIPIGAPVVADDSAGVDSRGMQIVKLATEGEAPVPGRCGVLVYEYGPAAYAGRDPYTTTYSDLDAAPLGAGVQVVSGDPAAKVVLGNTVARSFLGIRPYPGRVMVAGMGATPSVQVGSYLTPGKGDDVDGYWEVGTAANGWLVVTAIDTVRDEVEARMLF